jgi:hypothetical protein
VFFSPRKSNAKKSHLLFEQGMEGGTSMAPLKGEGVGWERLPHLFLANYGCRLSRGYAPCLRQPTTQEWMKLPGFNPAECHKIHSYQKGVLVMPSDCTPISRSSARRDESGRVSVI